MPKVSRCDFKTTAQPTFQVFDEKRGLRAQRSESSLLRGRASRAIARLRCRVSLSRELVENVVDAGNQVGGFARCEVRREVME
jgi:hypothetical protein